MMFSAASQLAELGYRVFPCRSGEKTPATAHGCKDATLDDGQISAWWESNPQFNIGISTDGLLVLDVDPVDGQPNPWLEPQLACELNSVSGAISRTPRGGFHYWFRAPDGSDLRNTTSKIAPNVDTRANGGYVIASPSRTANGMYAWVPGHELDRPPEALPEPPPWLLRALNGSDTGKSSSPPQQPADANYGSGAEPIASGKRNATLTSLGGTLRKRGLSQLAIEAALRATNAERCNPPLDDNEIKTIAWSVSRYEPDQIATLAAEGADVEPLKPITLGELIATYPTLNEPIVDGILRRGEVANIIAKSKVGKSWLSYGLGLSVATGGRWFGRFGCTQGRVLLLDNELQRPTLSSRIPRVAQSMGIDPADVADSFHVLPLRGRLKSIDELLPFFREIPEGMYALVVIDALYRMLPAGMDKNNNAAMAQVYNTLDRYATMTGAAFALVHHASKGSQSDKDVVDVGSGAGSQSRAADTHLVLRPHEEPDSVVLDAAVRSWAPVSPIGLRWQFPLWTFDGNLDPSKLKGLKTDGESRKAAKELDDGAVVMEALETAGPLTLNKLTTHTGIGRDRLAKIVGLLLKGKRIISIEETVRGNVCDVYAVNPNPPKPITFSGYSQAIGLSDEF